MNMVRKIGALVIALAAVVVWFAMAPSASGDERSKSGASADAVDLVMALDSSNQDRAEGAPQQAVVNGWAARDLLEILARQGAESGVDSRPAALLVLTVFGVALMLFTTATKVENGSPVAEAPPTVSPVDSWMGNPKTPQE